MHQSNRVIDSTFIILYYVVTNNMTVNYDDFPLDNDITANSILLTFM